MSRWIAFIVKNKIAAAAVALVLLGGGVWYWSASRPAKIETFTVSAGEFVQQVSVSGKVTASQSVDLGFAQSGRVTRVAAKVGSIVRAGTVLAEVENGDLRANVLQREAALETQQAKLAALKQGTRPEEIAVAESAVRSDTVALDRAAQAVIDAVRDAHTTSDDAVRNKVDPFISNPRSVNPELSFQSTDFSAELATESGRISAGFMLAKWQSEVLELSTSSDLSMANASANANLRSVLALLTNANAALNRAIITADTTQSEVDAYITAVVTARTSVNTKTSALTTAFTAFKTAQANLEASEKNLALKRAGTIQADIDAQAAQVKAAEADLANAHALLSRTLVRAPFTGVVTKMDAKVGKIVSSNTSEISMLSTDMFQIESYIPEIHIAMIELKDTAAVTLDAYGEDVPFAATVVSIDPAETVRDGVATYRAILQFTAKDPRIKSGMTANVMITTERKENVLSVPQGAVSEKDGKRFVRVLADTTEEDREVIVGSVSSLGLFEIISGLSAGEQVVLPVAE